MIFSPTFVVTAIKLATSSLSIRSEDPAINTTSTDTFDVGNETPNVSPGMNNSTLSEEGETPTSGFPISSYHGGPAYNGTGTVNVTTFADSSCTPPTYNPPPIPPITLPNPNRALATVYRYRQQQGVNIGSWFMLEGWMVPSLFSCAAAPAISEYDVATGWNGQAKQVLEKHWDTFITETDFAWLASLGINTVRLPLGYWHIGTGEQEWTTGTLYESVRDNYVGAWPRVLRAISMAEKYGIGVLVDLHGAPGSQNGQQHSGVSDGQANLFSSPSNMQKTISVLQFLTNTLVDVPNVVGIQLLNEPIDIPDVFDFYTNALNTLRGSSPAAQNFPFYVHDAFDLNQGANFVRSRGREWNILDHHSYFVFTPQDNSESASSHITDLSLAGSVGSALMNAGMGLNGNFIIGEWSCALSDDSLSVEEDPISSRKLFCDVQEQTYRDVSSGSTFWSFNKENCEQDPAWCFKSAVGNSLPSSFFSYEGLTVAKNLSAAGAGVTSYGAEGNWTQTNSPASAAPTTLSDSALAVPGTVSPDTAILTTVDPGFIPSATGVEAPAESTGAPTPTPPDGSSTPSIFSPMQRSLNSKPGQSMVQARGQAPPFPEDFSHGDQPGANVPVSISAAVANPARNNQLGCFHRSCRSKNAAASTHKGWRPSGMERWWRAQEHRFTSIHKRRMRKVEKVKRQEDVSPTQSTSRVAFATIPVSQSVYSQLPGIQLETAAVPHSTPTSGIMDVSRNDSSLYTSGAPQLTLAQQAIQQGFSDGFMTAKMFAQQGPGMSRLGFKWQYVEDSLAAHSSNVAPGKEGYYREWFEKGLTQGEALVAQVIASMNV